MAPTATGSLTAIYCRFVWPSDSRSVGVCETLYPARPGTGKVCFDDVHLVDESDEQPAHTVAGNDGTRSRGTPSPSRSVQMEVLLGRGKRTTSTVTRTTSGPVAAPHITSSPSSSSSCSIGAHRVRKWRHGQRRRRRRSPGPSCSPPGAGVFIR
uniref:Uncharacterized protein n=1 Tax=Anopheles coluzzii TaxID=1518534 RepID=A0A8W7PV97_ANOCL